MRLRNKELKKLTLEELNKVIDEIKKLYIDEGHNIDFLVSYFDSTKSFMYSFLKKYNIIKSKEQINLERSNQCKISISNKTNKEKESIKEKRKQTNLEKYGVENPYQSEDIKDKIKQQNIEKYGVEYSLQRKDVKEKIDNTLISKYGVKRIIQSENGKKKYKNTCLQRYGVDNPSKLKEKKLKIKKTCLERYGNEIPCRTQEIQDKMKKNSLEKWGTEYPSQNLQISNKISLTHLSKTQEEKDKILKKRKQTKLEKYGDENYNNKEKIKESHRNMSIEQKTIRHLHQLKAWNSKTEKEKQEILNKRIKTNMERYNVPWTCMREEARINSGAISKINQSFANRLDQFNINYEMECVLDNFSYDFKIENTLLEINPTYSHNTTVTPIFNNSPVKKEPISKFYHLNKTETAQKYGLRCIHVFDWDDWNKIISFFIPKQKLYARKCEIKEVSKQECNEFLNLYHLQSTCRGQTIRLGLYYDNVLVQIMTFGQPRYNKNYEWELLRLCSNSKYVIVGGSQRLWKHFLDIYNPSNIISYCDVSKFSGKVYETLGMELLQRTVPNKIWSKHHLKITNNLLNQQGADRLIGTNLGKNTSNYEIMIANGWKEIYDCGQLVFSYSK